MKRPSGKTIVKYIPTVITFVCTLAGILYILIKGKIETESLLGFVRAHDTIAVPVILFLFALKGVLVVLPYSLLTTVTGLLFDFVPALLINLAGTALCMTVPYLTGKSAKREDVLEKIQNNRILSKYYTGKETDLFPLCFALRLAGVQSEMLSIFFGNIGMPFFPYLAASLLGKLSLMICYTILGSTLSAAELSPVALIFFLLDAAMLVLSLIVFRKKRKKGDNDADGEESETVPAMTTEADTATVESAESEEFEAQDPREPVCVGSNEKG